MKPVAMLCGVVLALTACSASDAGSSPSTLPPVSPTPSNPTLSPSPSSAPLVLPEPEEAKAATTAGAEAFARYWFDVLNASYAAVDPGPVQRISDPGCRTCQNYIDSMQRAINGAYTFEGGSVSVVSAAAAPIEGSVAGVLVTVKAQGMRSIDRQGNVLQTVPAVDSAVLDVEIKRREPSWIVVEVGPT